MSVAFPGTQRLLNTSPPITTGSVWSMGLWVMVTSGISGGSIIAAFRNTAETHIIGLQGVNFGSNFGFNSNAGGSDASITGVAITTGAWFFHVLRSISTTNRRLSSLSPDGATTHGQNTTSRNPTINRALLGTTSGTQTFTGRIAEWWLAAGDIVPGNGAMPDAMLRQLAYRGPFSMPHVAANVLHYLSMGTIGSAQDRAGDVYFGSARSPWTPSGTLQLAPHPPLPGNYRGPDRSLLNLAV